MGGLEKIDLFFFTIENQILTNLFAFLMIVWFINLYNFLDGIDGYAGSEAIFLGLARFYEDNIKLLESIIPNPQNIDNYEKLNNKLGRYFHDFLTTNIIDENTQLIVDKLKEILE